MVLTKTLCSITLLIIRNEQQISILKLSRDTEDWSNDVIIYSHKIIVILNIIYAKHSLVFLVF